MSALPAPAPVDRFAHQGPAVEFALARPGAIWDAGMSAGKSNMYLELGDRTEMTNVIALCPRNVVGVFPREHRKRLDRGGREHHVWAGVVQGARGPLASPTSAQRAVELVEQHKYALITRKPLLAVVNYESAYRREMAAVLTAIARSAPTLLVLDESHKLKAPGGRASRFAQRLGAVVRAGGGKVIGGSGTFTPHSPLDAYAQLRAANPAILGTSFKHVQARYGRPKVAYSMTSACVLCNGAGGDSTCACGGTGTVRTDVPLQGPNGQPIYDGILDERADEYARKLALAVHRIDQATIDRNLGLGQPIDQVRTIPLDPRTRRIYDRLQRDLVAQFERGTIVAANSMVNTTRLAQVASGYAPDADDPGVEHQLSDPPELYRLLLDVLDEIPPGEPVAVAARFRNDLRWVARAAEQSGRRYAELSGERRDGLTADSEMNPDVGLLGVQIKAGGTGVDLTRAHLVIDYSMDFDLGDRLQWRRRFVREGQRHAVTFIGLQAENTIHQAIHYALLRRQRVNDAFLDYMKELTS